MKTKVFYIIFLFLVAIFTIKDISYAATVGNPIDLDLPPRSIILRQQVIDQTLNDYEEALKIKISFDAEFVFEKELNTTWEVSNAEVGGQWHMGKIGTTIFNRIEPYVKLGSSTLEVKWRQNNTDNIEITTDYGFAFGGGVKLVLLELDNLGVRLTADTQYRVTEPNVDEIVLEGTTVNDSGADFKIEEWQASIALSKKFELPLRWQSIYVVPYTGITLSDSSVEVAFNDPNAPGTDYSLFDANNDSIYGFFMGCDIMPNLTSSFIYSMEIRLLNEMALTFGGTLKF